MVRSPGVASDRQRRLPLRQSTHVRCGMRGFSQRRVRYFLAPLIVFALLGGLYLLPIGKPADVRSRWYLSPRSGQVSCFDLHRRPWKWHVFYLLILYGEQETEVEVCISYGR